MNPVWDVLRDGPFEGTYEEMLIASAQLCRRSEILNGTNNNEANGVLAQAESVIRLMGESIPHQLAVLEREPAV